MEAVSDYIRRLERAFQIAYGHEKLTTETQDALLYNQLHAGLKLSLVESPAVSGSLIGTYKQLCLAAKQEEQRLADLRRRKLYREQPHSGREPRLDSKGPTTRPFTTGGSRPYSSAYNDKP